jgi:hypothetical protein
MDTVYVICDIEWIGADRHVEDVLVERIFYLTKEDADKDNTEGGYVIPLRLKK